MWTLSVPWWEFVVRGLIVYVAILVLMRLSGKRQIGQLTPFDLVLLLIISNAVQNAMNAGDNSVLGGLILAGTLFLTDSTLGYFTWRSRRFEALVGGRPQIVIHQGQVFEEVMRRERISTHELHKALRRNGCTRVDDVHFAILETDGSISVKMKERPLDSSDHTTPGTLWRQPDRFDIDTPV
nr:YetF domain-containing protein [uncultured Cupriavidus sp.]